MSTGLRVLLILMAVISTISVIRRIRKSRMRIEYAVFWVLFSAGLVVLALFPQICYFFAGLLGIMSPANFVFAVIIALLLMKSFFMTAEISKLDEQVRGLTQTLALQQESGKNPSCQAANPEPVADAADGAAPLEGASHA